MVLEWRERLELAANWERVRHGCTEQRSVEFLVMYCISPFICLRERRRNTAMYNTKILNLG